MMKIKKGQEQKGRNTKEETSEDEHNAAGETMLSPRKHVVIYAHIRTGSKTKACAAAGYSRQRWPEFMRDSLFRRVYFEEYNKFVNECRTEIGLELLRGIAKQLGIALGVQEERLTSGSREEQDAAADSVLRMAEKLFHLTAPLAAVAANDDTSASAPRSPGEKAFIAETKVNPKVAKTLADMERIEEGDNHGSNRKKA